jgi:DNA polymerase-3 subunit delta'
MFFKQIPGKQNLKNQLIAGVQKNQIPHAQIFLGAEGCGGLPMALAYATYIMCENRDSEDSCGQCRHCIKNQKWIHPDVHFSFPAVNVKGSVKRSDVTSTHFLPQWRKILDSHPYLSISDWVDFVSTDTSLPNINVKECNEIIQKLSMMSYESPYKILIMWLPEYLGHEGNRLLKLIEEPAENTVIILVAENQDKILQTILSRCRIIKIPAFDAQEIQSYLTEVENLDEDMAVQWAYLSEGNLNKALNYARHTEKGFSDLWVEWLRTAYKGHVTDIHHIITQITSLSKDEQINFYYYGLHFLRQLIFMQFTHSEKVMLTPQETEVARKISSILDASKSEAIMELLNEAIDNVSRNVNMKIALFSDTLEIGQILKGQIHETKDTYQG